LWAMPSLLLIVTAVVKIVVRNPSVTHLQRVRDSGTIESEIAWHVVER
jgi:hypothetical protein